MDTQLPPPENDLLHGIVDALQQNGLTAAIDLPEPPLAEARIRIGYAGHQAVYAVEAKRGLRPATLGAVIHQVQRPGPRRLLVADYVTPPIAEKLRDQRVAFVDLAGNAYLDDPPLLVWVKGQKPPRIEPGGAPTRAGTRIAWPTGAGRAFQPTGIQVLFALICRPDWAAMPYRELARNTGVAHGTVGWVMAELPKLGFMAKVNGKRRLLRRERLLQQWAEFYPLTLRPGLLLGRYRADTLDWADAIDTAKYGAVLGGEPAGARMTGHLRPEAVTLYAPRLDPRLLIDLKLRNDVQGNVEVLRKFWTFDDEPEHPGLAPAPLIYADLMATGDGRCMETAKVIFDRLFEDHA